MRGSSVVPGLPVRYSTPAACRISKKACRPAMRGICKSPLLRSKVTNVFYCIDSYFVRWNILHISEEAEDLMQLLRQQRIRIGSQGLRRAVLTLLYGFTEVTSNVRGFSQVPNLSVVDWTVASQ